MPSDERIPNANAAHEGPDEYADSILLRGASAERPSSYEPVWWSR